MRKLLRFLLLKPVTWMVSRFSSRPDRKRIFKALSRLYRHIQQKPGKKGIIIPFDLQTGKFIVFSDQHKGAKNGADDFADAENNYLAALGHYYNKGFHLICLGDNEELWENSLGAVKKNNTASFEAEKKFIPLNAFTKVFGNHDLYWDNDPLASWQLKRIYDAEVKIHEGIILQSVIRSPDSAVNDPNYKLQTIGSQLPSPVSRLNIFLTHGHQGDGQSDGNWFSKFFVARIWAPFQAYLKINPNTPAYDLERKTTHNNMMYEWSSKQKDLILITGHTHQPVFASLTHLERLYRNLREAEQKKDAALAEEIRKAIHTRERKLKLVSGDQQKIKPSYFNSGCCCFADGDITGIEIENGTIRLIKWEWSDAGSCYSVLEEAPLDLLVTQL